MLQLVLKDGVPATVEVPSPQVRPGCILVAVNHSSISAGTERSVMSQSDKGWVRDLLEHPRRLKRALVLSRSEGVRAGRRKLLSDYVQARALGYSVSGRVLAVGDGVGQFSPGDLVACAGAQCAFHAGIVCVPKNLCVRIPSGLSSQDASTVALGAIALHGVRQVEPQFGARIGVAGLGLLGCLAAQFLRSSGCRVVAWDPRPERVQMARKLGLEEVGEKPPSHLESKLDSVLVAASTRREGLLGSCADLTRHKGRIVLLGDVPVQVERWRIYQKEIELRMSTSYGPGRYDPAYEEEGLAYPPGYVPFTETRNMEVYLEALASGKVRLDKLTRAVVPVSMGKRAYQNLSVPEPPLLLHLSFPEARNEEPASNSVREASSSKIGLALVGVGQFARAVHLPNLEKLSEQFSLRTVVTRDGLKASTTANLYTAKFCATSLDEVLSDEGVDAVLLANRHDSHARMTVKALQANKHVFVEKPLALSQSELEEVRSAVVETDRVLMTGFNRAFAPSVVALSRFLAERRGPVVLNYRMNAGRLPADHWVYSSQGGGRNLGEACHIYHLFLHLVRSPLVTIQATAGGAGRHLSDNFLVNLRFEDGSLAHLCYQSEGHFETPKERLEGFVDGHTFVLDDYRSLSVAGPREKHWSGAQNKGHLAILRAFGRAIQGGEETMGREHQLEATRVALVVEEQLRTLV